ncbi:HAMP domain-containing protein [bacterium]|nr:MAG: HAMP domain-containing protein [bacterium]
MSIKAVLILTIIAFIVVFVFAKIVSNSVSAPLERLRKAMHEVSAGKMDVRARVETSDEIGSLASSFNKMVSDLEDSRRDTIIINNELMKANRDLLANEENLRMNNQTVAESEEELRAANQELLANEESLRRMTEELEEKVRQRTRELERERNALEIKVQERTKELEIKLKTLAEMNEKMTGRELRMIELKKQINGLMKELGKPVPYDI